MRAGGCMSASVSVVIPAYRAGNFLHRAVESVHAQTRPDWEAVNHHVEWMGGGASTTILGAA
jgi:hypothetical protein